MSTRSLSVLSQLYQSSNRMLSFHLFNYTQFCVLIILDKTLTMANDFNLKTFF